MAPTARRAGLAPASAWRDVCGFPRSSTQHAGDKPRPHRPRQQGGGGAPSEGRGRRRGRSSCQGEHLRLTYRFLKEATATLRRESEAEAPISISGTLQPPHAQALPRWGGCFADLHSPLNASAPRARAPRDGARQCARTPGLHGPSPEPEWGAFCFPRERGLFGSLCPTSEGRRGRTGGGRQRNAHSSHSHHSLSIRGQPQDIRSGSKISKSSFQKIFTVGRK